MLIGTVTPVIEASQFQPYARLDFSVPETAFSHNKFFFFLKIQIASRIFQVTCLPLVHFDIEFRCCSGLIAKRGARS